MPKAVKKKLPVAGGLRVNTYAVLREAVERGVAFGWRRAHKHNPKPDSDAVCEAIEGAVVGEVLEWFAIEEPVA